MTFIPVDELPVQRKKSYDKRNGDFLREFLKMNVKYARMDITEFDYAHAFSAYSSIKRVISFHGLPVNVKLINHDIYLINLELEDK